uniref:Uncharacterized protein n=1 Tax=Anguilla anguilla TaxID=7936 RepID=A0A0E9UJE9_ANGAN
MWGLLPVVVTSSRGENIFSRSRSNKITRYLDVCPCGLMLNALY